MAGYRVSFPGLDLSSDQLPPRQVQHRQTEKVLNLNGEGVRGIELLGQVYLDAVDDDRSVPIDVFGCTPSHGRTEVDAASAKADPQVVENVDDAPFSQDVVPRLVRYGNHAPAP
jgi:hypothetical protein